MVHPIKPCPDCGCALHRLAYGIGCIAIACYRCEACGPDVTLLRVNPTRLELATAVRAWNAYARAVPVNAARIIANAIHGPVTVQ